MGSAAISPCQSVGALLRQKRREFNLSLNEVSRRLTVRGHRIPPSTLGRIEQGRLDPGVRRLYLLLELYRIPPHLVSDLVELEMLAGEPETVVPDDLQALHDKGVEHWKSGNVKAGLAYLLAVREYVPETDDARVLRQQASLAFATAARNLGKYRLARQIVDDLLCEPPVAEVLVRALVLSGSLWRGLGSLDAALGMIRQAEERLRPDDRKERAWVLHQKAKLLLEAGEVKQAGQALARAVESYREVQDAYGEVRALVLCVALEEAKGQPTRAARTARQVIELSERHGYTRGVIYGHIELGRLLSKTEDQDAGMEHLRQGLGEAVRIGEPNAQFTAHYHLWKAHEAGGDRERAAFELNAASYFVRLVDEHTPEVDEVRRLNREDRK